MSNNPFPTNQPNKQSTDFELFFRISIDAMIIADLDGKIVDFNQAYETITVLHAQNYLKKTAVGI